MGRLGYVPSLLCAEFVMGRVCHVPSLLYAELSLNQKKSGRNDSPNLAETTQGRNDPGPKRLRAETTRDHINIFHICNNK